MWIRSQMKGLLVNVDRFEIYGVTKVTIRADEKTILGEYSTKEKALKVLNMIEPIIKGNYIWECIFQMPQDNEV